MRGQTGEELRGFGTSVCATICLAKHVRGKWRNRLFKMSGSPTRVLPAEQPEGQGHSRAGACRGGTSPFKPVHDVLLLSGPCQNGFVMFQVAIKYRKRQRRLFLGPLATGGKLAALRSSSTQLLPVTPDNEALGDALSKGHQIKVRLKPDL